MKRYDRNIKVQFILGITLLILLLVAAIFA